MSRLIFGTAVAVILLGFYAYAVVIAILATQCLSEPNCTAYSKDLNEGIVTILNLVGGLVSALVVAELAVTEPGKAPATRYLAIDVRATTKNVAVIISFIYIAVWLICGVASVIVGYIQHPDVVPVLTNSAKSWMGIAVAAAYSYLGVRQSGS